LLADWERAELQQNITALVGELQALRSQRRSAGVAGQDAESMIGRKNTKIDKVCCHSSNL